MGAFVNRSIYYEPALRKVDLVPLLLGLGCIAWAIFSSLP